MRTRDHLVERIPRHNVVTGEHAAAALTLTLTKFNKLIYDLLIYLFSIFLEHLPITF